jgi:hypothetical protein
MFRKALFILVLVCLVAIPAFAQGDTTPPASSTSSGAFSLSLPAVDLGKGTSFVRFVHTSVDAGPVDIYVGAKSEKPVVTNLAFGDYTPLITLTGGQLTLVARHAGAAPSTPELFSLKWNFAPNTSWIVATGGLDSHKGFLLQPISIIRNQYKDQARVRVVNFVWGGERLGLRSEAKTGFGKMLAWIGMDDEMVEAGKHNLQLVSASGKTLADAASFDFAANTTYTLLIIGSEDGSETPRILNIPTEAETTRVRFINQRSAAYQVLVRPGNIEFMPSLAAGATGDFIALPSGSATFVLYKPGTAPTGQQQGGLVTQLHPGQDVTITVSDTGLAVTDVALTPS